jgi:transposase
MVPQALNVLDRFHVVMNLNKAVDQVRAQEARELKRKGFSILARSKYCFLKRRENLTPKQRTKLREILRHPLKTVRAWRLKEELNVFWEYKSPTWANWFLGKWLRRATRSKITPIKRVAKTIRRHRELILNWFRIQKEFSNGITEGCNRKVDLAIRRAYGFRSFEVFKVAMFHNFGQLPEPCKPRAMS